MPVRTPAGGTCGKDTKTRKPGPIGNLQRANLGDLSRDASKDWPTKEMWIADVHREDYEPVLDRTFPNVVQRGDPSPTGTEASPLDL